MTLGLTAFGLESPQKQGNCCTADHRYSNGGGIPPADTVSVELLFTEVSIKDASVLLRHGMVRSAER